ncbi:hypothetical protein HM131_02420 [Halobacillus mangrovi]|uniref:Uncharacterized protein n=1 Tax=Halobacillus mangrovi TaxID=402384 RepID=A0A1W5ZR38_9BACI|nr:hypothetical protein HM131_02420 [Halobacillus mangrovi]
MRVWLGNGETPAGEELDETPQESESFPRHTQLLPLERTQLNKASAVVFFKNKLHIKKAQSKL